MEEEQEGLIKQSANIFKDWQTLQPDKELYKIEARRKALDFAMVEIRGGRNEGKSLLKTAEEIYLWLMGESKKPPCGG